ncbi:hypothetical protein B0I72DRAFT_140597 [Yarrowia lipolytica]|uniref:Uncharacterized protein n=1 Tax=Yarrowia lipolytica TaxID=4952 RepID=A0A371CAH9_YARLL|nr:hypothetical protein BKA91DRAFT_137000 [Yarrowia lipolytica]KAE8172445.1 hypothetical protein BKA90DRAFT_137232 [Yarrowia lipolytica]KAJ8053296.1 hypothetical protein LXG23DRAFT_37458 [Yarrowia lipolytica]QNP96544.1 Hypothetical protein YALI2_C00197g [Yarrowia lipolytica]RDW27283.1 hypothetical protein B0I71DRAFT_129484 [Yarrowia lipolytica]
MSNEKAVSNHHQDWSNEDLESAPLVSIPHVTAASRHTDFGFYSATYTTLLAFQTSVYITAALVVVDRVIYTMCNDDHDYPLQNPNLHTVMMRWANAFGGQFFAMRSFVLLKSQSREGHSFLVIGLFAILGLVFTMASFLVQFQEVWAE